MKILFSYLKTGKKILMFDNIAIEKNKFYHHIIGKVLVANKISFDEKNYN